MRSVRTTDRRNENSIKPIEVLIVDDVDIIRLGLKLVLNNAPAFKVVGECTEGGSAVSMACRLKPDIVLMDVGMPKMNGIEAAAQIKEQVQNSHVIMFTSHDNDDEILAAFNAGADGYCLKDLSSEDLLLAITKVYEGQRWIDPRLMRRVVELTGWNRRDSKSERHRLLGLELKILRLMEQGSNGKEIANQTGLDISQVRKVVSHVVEKIFEAGGVQGSFRSPAVLDFSEVRHGVPERVIEESVLAQKLDSSTPAVLRTEGAFAGRYKIERVIGKGGMGVVYKARHLLMERTVAIKVLYPESASDLKAVAQFKKESQAASALKHHNIVSVYDFGVTEAGQPFLVMDYINGVSLDKLFQEKEHIEPLRHVDMFLQVCDGLAVTHTHGLVHCDLKPSNIMVEKDATGKDSIKIVDFGLAKVMPVSASVQARLTDAFEITGSPLYMSPEHCKGNTLDARSDIYSLGCIMYEAFTGKPVFDGASPYKVFSQHLIDDPLAFAVVQSGRQLPPEMETIVLKALKKNPDERYQSALELKHDLIQLKARLTNGAVVAL